MEFVGRGTCLRLMVRPIFLVLLTALFLAGCVSDGRSLRPGADAAAVRAEMGKPYEIVKLPDGGEAWFYPRGYVGRQTFRAALAPDGRLRNVEQVLDEQHFDQIVAFKSTSEDLHQLLGPPNYVWRGSLSKQIIWDYSYYWGAQHRWRVRFGIDDNGLVTGQVRQSEENGPASRQ
jgi:hypothetical protein